MVTPGAPWRVKVTGNRAYVAAPSTYAIKQHGKAATESNAVFTAVRLDEINCCPSCGVVFPLEGTVGSRFRPAGANATHPRSQSD